eukprot:3328620-Pyramimonas_sp.AAC.1
MGCAERSGPPRSSVAPNSPAAARASTRGQARPQRCTSQRQAFIAIAFALDFANQVAGGRVG